MRWFPFVLTLAVAPVFIPSASGQVVFDTNSLAVQTITSPVFGGAVPLSASGTQHFTVNPATGFAGVTSVLHGTDMPNPAAPGTFMNYDLYNTTTNGSITGLGPYVVNFDVLFELRVTSGPFTGLIFETQQFGTFTASNVASLPFPNNTNFSDPTPPDTVAVFVKTDPTGTFQPGTLVGTSSDRLVTIVGVVPEPSSLALVGAGLGLAAWRRRRAGRRENV